ncbi:uncharacterized protein FFB20_02552 [Fusarium fujikuroi]|nr:uncharacterized protein FFB20_02552 [Fusarium fujikuroi]SCN82679.1 uncharacterized protein FFE2_05177 [Fusarium fujikuroi]SCN84217.1 uncharacterized protein FFC1_04467 [Fusarium fujikuroi]SCO34782.1 uncharacterized protein FFNC_04034 [Fusarium fujikuroi]SCV36015.1 uncharacterized protein FFFS_04991 [Fusarium fujikuroi]
METKQKLSPSQTSMIKALAGSNSYATEKRLSKSLRS